MNSHIIRAAAPAIGRSPSCGDDRRETEGDKEARRIDARDENEAGRERQERPEIAERPGEVADVRSAHPRNLQKACIGDSGMASSTRLYAYCEEKTRAQW